MLILQKNMIKLKLNIKFKTKYRKYCTTHLYTEEEEKRKENKGPLNTLEEV